LSRFCLLHPSHPGLSVARCLSATQKTYNTVGSRLLRRRPRSLGVPLRLRSPKSYHPTHAHAANQATFPTKHCPTNAFTHCSHPLLSRSKTLLACPGLSQFRGGTRQSRGEHKRIRAAEKTNSEPARRALPARKGRKGGEKGAGFRLASTQKSCWASAEQGKAEASRADPGGQNQKPEGRNQEAGKFWGAESRCKLQKLGIYGKLAQNATKCRLQLGKQVGLQGCLKVEIAAPAGRWNAVISLTRSRLRRHW
jgi:hypothetical protein